MQWSFGGKNRASRPQIGVVSMVHASRSIPTRMRRSAAPNGPLVHERAAKFAVCVFSSTRSLLMNGSDAAVTNRS
jgi:hypothetical protein